MSKIPLHIENGPYQLLSNENFLADLSDPVTVSIPIMGGSFFSITFIINDQWIAVPTSEVISNGENSITINVRIGNTDGSYIGTKNRVDFYISGAKYQILFSVKKIIHKTVRIAISLFEVKKGLLNV